MKPTKENLQILKKLGFTCDKNRTGNKMDTEWYSLPNGWGFRLDAVEDFAEMMENLQYSYLDKFMTDTKFKNKTLKTRMF